MDDAWVLRMARRRQAEALKRYIQPAGAPLWLRLALSLIAVAAMVGFAAQAMPAVNLAALAIVFSAAALSSIGGFAFSALCGALLFHVMSPLPAVQLMIVCSIAIQAVSVLALRNAIDWRLLGRFLLGGIVSLPLGVYLLLHLDAGIYCRILGAFLVLYGSYMLLRPAATLSCRSRWPDTAAGLLGGITGGFAGFPGAFVTIWCGLKGWAKDRQRGVYQPFILIMQILALAMIAFAATGPRYHGLACGLDVLFYLPAAALGTWCGLGWYRRLSDRQFARVVNLLLIAAGAALAL